jgi:protein-tyrosine phosphatase
MALAVVFAGFNHRYGQYVIDLHTHILPGFDDGARTLQDSISMARAAVSDGVRIVAATPHVRADYPTRASEMERGVAELREALAAEDVQLEVRTGGEIALDRLAILAEEELARFGLAANPSYLLLEFPYYGWPLDLPSQVCELRRKGIGAVIAHPERNANTQAFPDRMQHLVDLGALVQVTSASLDGRLGRAACKTAFRLIELGLAHLIASDAHAPDVRAIGMKAAADAVGNADLALWLTAEVPAAIAAGNEIPDRPRARRPRLGRYFRR